MVRSGNPRIRHWTYSRIMPFKIGYQSRFCMFLLSLTLLGRWLRRLCGSLSGGELSPGGEWGWRGSSRWEIVEETRKNKIYLVVVVVVVVFDNFRERQVGDCEENLEKWNIFGCCCHCGLLLKILWRAIVKKTRKNKIYLGFCRFGLFLLHFSQIVVLENLFCKCTFWTLVCNFSFQHLMYLIGGRLFMKLDEIVHFWLFSR